MTNVTAVGKKHPKNGGKALSSGERRRCYRQGEIQGDVTKLLLQLQGCHGQISHEGEALKWLIILVRWNSTPTPNFSKSPYFVISGLNT